MTIEWREEYQHQYPLPFVGGKKNYKKNTNYYFDKLIIILIISCKIS